MTDILNQDEIDQLLSAISTGDTTIETVSKSATQKKIRLYDFRRPSKFSKEQTRAIQMIYDQFARLSQTTLAALLRTPTQINVASVDELTYEEFTRSIPTPTTLALIHMDPLQGSAVFEMDPSITFAIIDRIFGGAGTNQTKNNRELTDIESAVVENIVVRLLSHLREAWSNFVDLRPRLGSIDTNPEFLAIVAPTEMTILVTLETKIGDVEGMSNFCLPHITLEPIVGKIKPHTWYTNFKKSGNSSQNFSFIKENLEKVNLDLVAEFLKTSIKFKDIMDLNVGDIIQFPNSDLNKDIDILIGQNIKYKGKPGVYKGNTSVQITEVIEEINDDDILVKEDDDE